MGSCLRSAFFSSYRCTLRKCEAVATGPQLLVPRLNRRSLEASPVDRAQRSLLHSEDLSDSFISAPRAQDLEGVSRDLIVSCTLQWLPRGPALLEHFTRLSEVTLNWSEVHRRASSPWCECPVFRRGWPEQKWKVVSCLLTSIACTGIAVTRSVWQRHRLQPKIGLLGMILDPILDAVVDDAYIVPVSIYYDGAFQSRLVGWCRIGRPFHLH